MRLAVRVAVGVRVALACVSQSAFLSDSACVSRRHGPRRRRRWRALDLPALAWVGCNLLAPIACCVRILSAGNSGERCAGNYVGACGLERRDVGAVAHFVDDCAVGSNQADTVTCVAQPVADCVLEGYQVSLEGWEIDYERGPRRGNNDVGARFELTRRQGVLPTVVAQAPARKGDAVGGRIEQFYKLPIAIGSRLGRIVEDLGDAERGPQVRGSGRRWRCAWREGWSR